MPPVDNGAELSSLYSSSGSAATHPPTAAPTAAVLAGPSIRVEVVTDYFPRELSWNLVYQPPPVQEAVVEETGTTYREVYPEPIVVDELVTGQLTQESTQYSFTYLIADIDTTTTTFVDDVGRDAAPTGGAGYAGTYALILKDSAGDGICCGSHGNGMIRVVQLDPMANANANDNGQVRSTQSTELASFDGIFEDAYVIEFYTILTVLSAADAATTTATTTAGST